MRRAARISACAISVLAVAVSLLVVGADTPAAQSPDTRNCQNTGRFETWLRDFRRTAAAEGVKPATLSAVLDDMTLDPGVIARDRRQTFFGQSFVDFRGKLISRNRLQSGQRQMERHRATFARAEKEYGVPAPVIT